MNSRITDFTIISASKKPTLNLENAAKTIEATVFQNTPQERKNIIIKRWALDVEKIIPQYANRESYTMWGGSYADSYWTLQKKMNEVIKSAFQAGKEQNIPLSDLEAALQAQFNKMTEKLYHSVEIKKTSEGNIPMMHYGVGSKIKPLVMINEIMNEHPKLSAVMGKRSKVLDENYYNISAAEREAPQNSENLRDDMREFVQKLISSARKELENANSEK